MAGNIMMADINFPDLSGKESTEEKLQAVESYLFMLLEQLRYALSNLDRNNFNDEGLKELGKVITEPVEIRLKDAEGNFAQLSASARGLASAVSAADGRATQALQTANGFSNRITSAENRVTTIEQNINGIRIATEDDISGLSGNALYFYDPEGPTNNPRLVGLIRMDDKGSAYETDNPYRMIIAAWPGYQQHNYSLKLQSAGNSSYESAQSIFITARKTELGANASGKGRVQLNGGGEINTCNGDELLTIKPVSGKTVRIYDDQGTYYEFKSDGIYHNGTKVVTG